LAGGNYGRRDGVGEQAQLGRIRGMVLDRDGNLLVADSSMNVIRKITMAGEVTTVAGSGRYGNQDGKARDASFKSPFGMAIDGAGAMYVADCYSGRVRKITQDGDVLTLTRTRGWFSAPDEGLQYDLNYPDSIVATADGTVYVVDGSDQIYQISQDGKISVYLDRGVRRPTAHGGEPGITPDRLGLDSAERLVVTDRFAGLIWRIPAQRAVEILVGPKNTYATHGFLDGDRSVAKASQPYGTAFDQAGNLYFTDEGNHSVRRLSTDGHVTTLLGDGRIGNILGIATEARLSSPGGIVVGHDGCLYVADVGNYRILKISLNQ
jgi:DNA-binding beta-propeller fold protein YncE